MVNPVKPRIYLTLTAKQWEEILKVKTKTGKGEQEIIRNAIDKYLNQPNH